MYRYLTMLLLGVVTATGTISPLGAASDRTEIPTLTKISSRVDERAGIVAIEASAPVPYVASQPDARTYIVELRDVVAREFADTFKADPRHPVGLAADGRRRALLALPRRARGGGTLSPPSPAEGHGA